MNILIRNLASIAEAAEEFKKQIDGRNIFAFRGKMGAGKTTFIKAVCKALGVTEIVNSPSFAIINEYFSEITEETIYHFDFYRIIYVQDAVNIGVLDYFNSDSLCFIEWPEKIEPLLPDDTVWVDIVELDDGVRHLKIT